MERLFLEDRALKSKNLAVLVFFCARRFSLNVSVLLMLVLLTRWASPTADCPP